MWDQHPGWMTFGITTWGINRLAWGFGLWGYSNPYYVASAEPVVYDYSQPIIEQPVYADTSQPMPTPPESALSNFDQARSDFYAGDYDKSLQSVNLALKEFPKDAVVHEFRALVLFALGRYSEAAATIHPVLAVGPGWDWATLVGLYPSVELYTQQLRKLETYTRSNPTAPDALFLLAYHYLTCDHKDAAHKTLQKVVTLQPGDAVAAQYLQMTAPSSTGDSDVVPVPPPTTAIPPDQLLTPRDLVGKWKATGGSGNTFTLELTDQDTFVWTFTQGKTSQSVKGVFAIDQNKLAMQPDTGGTMLADLTRKGGGFHFDLDGAPESDPGLTFTR